MPFRGDFLAHLRAWGCITICTAATLAHGQSRGERIALTYDYFGNAGSAGTFYLPIPPDTSCQRIESFHSNWGGEEIRNAASPAQRWLAGRPPGRGQLHWRVRIVGVFTQEPTSVAAPVPPGDLFEQTSEALDWDSSDFQDWLDGHKLRRCSDEGPTPFARRVYDYLTTHGEYTYPPVDRWTASGASRSLRTDCGGFSIVFVSACRANHVPARLLVGQWLKTGADGAVAGRQAHVMAEFYDAVTGWMPVDIYAGLMRTAGRDDYFGRQPGYFFTWHFDTDYQFNVPAGADGHVQWIQNPSPWFANASGESGSHRWTIEPLP